jgi:uncharacterized membrane protein YeiH
MTDLYFHALAIVGFALAAALLWSGLAVRVRPPRSKRELLYWTAFGSAVLATGFDLAYHGHTVWGFLAAGSVAGVVAGLIRDALPARIPDSMKRGLWVAAALVVLIFACLAYQQK